MNKLSKERKIKINIFALPIVSIVLLSIIISTVFVIFIENLQEQKIKELRDNLTTTAKNTTKERILDIEKEINHSIKDLDKDIKLFLKSRIHEASSVIYKIIKDNPKKSTNEIKKIVSQVLGAIRYNGDRGYYYIYDYTSKKILIHPIKKLIHKDFTNAKDKRGTLILKGDEEIAQGKGEGFKYLYFAKPDNPNKEFEKINYIKYIKELNWVIGTGEYIEDAKKELQEKLLKKIENKRYENNRYFWIHNTKYTLLAHPFRKKDIGRDDTDLKDSKGTNIIQLFIKSAKGIHEGAYVEYFWKKPDGNIEEKKLSFVKYIKEWNWVIGTGIYLNEIEILIQESKEKIEEEIRDLYLFVFSLITITLILIVVFSFYLSKQTGKLFNVYKNDLEGKIQKAVNQNIKKDKILQQQSKLASMGEMIGSIAHQWRQPLNALNINIQNLEDDFEDGLIDEDFLEEFTNKNTKIISFMSTTIDDFRNFFRIDKEKESFSVKKAIDDTISIQASQLQYHDIFITMSGKDFEIYGFKNEFKQVILNIINNSKDALIENNIVNPNIIITFDSNKISIKDNAKGIPEGIINRIFEPYFTTKEQGKGTGMGLYMSKMIIEDNMEGKIIVNNIKDGTEIIIKVDGEKK